MTTLASSRARVRRPGQISKPPTTRMASGGSVPAAASTAAAATQVVYPPPAQLGPGGDLSEQIVAALHAKVAPGAPRRGTLRRPPLPDDVKAKLQELSRKTADDINNTPK